MAKRTYRSAQGKQLDLGAILSQNENVPALGNMNVNARGDEIAPDGTITKTREQVMREYHDMSNTQIPQDDRIPESAEDTWQDWEPRIEQDLVKTSELATEDVEEAEPIEDVVEKPVETKPSAGLASAVAAARTVKSTVINREEPKEVSGVTRL
jgi:hypothetical protein